jgi:hypothetical protein
MVDISYEVLHYPIEGAPTPLDVGFETITKIGVVKWAKDHYWDSLDHEKELIIKHIAEGMKDEK